MTTKTQDRTMLTPDEVNAMANLAIDRRFMALLIAESRAGGPPTEAEIGSAAETLPESAVLIDPDAEPYASLTDRYWVSLSETHDTMGARLLYVGNSWVIARDQGVAAEIAAIAQ